MIIVKYIQEFLWSCCRQCGVNSVSDSSLFQLILLLEVYRPLPVQSMLTTGFQSVAPVSSKATLFILASSVCKPLQCLTSTLTQGGEGGHSFRLTCSVVWWGGRQIPLACVRSARSIGTTWVCPRSRRRVLSWSTLLRLHVALLGVLSKVGPAFHALPRCKLLRLRFLRTPQRHRLSWVCV